MVLKTPDSNRNETEPGFVRSHSTSSPKMIDIPSFHRCHGAHWVVEDLREQHSSHNGPGQPLDQTSRTLGHWGSDGQLDSTRLRTARGSRSRDEDA